MFICGIKFFLTVSRKIDFVTATYVPNKTYKTYIDVLESICTMYARRGFFVTAVFADPEFKTFESYLN